MSQANEATYWVGEYIRLERLKKLGIVTPSDEFDEVTLKIFIHISECFDKLQSDKAKKAKRKR